MLAAEFALRHAMSADPPIGTSLGEVFVNKLYVRADSAVAAGCGGIVGDATAFGANGVGIFDR
ncbi:hypothetical protein MAE02_12260 [Microvirga aerophila]|uniref:Uncharacterized protein n=1 Tax=Microvirga aerophila TaxID=670291 RepID=A0A512BNK3_9HYPH|nr:hypothetical protein MAE02_12260 [Microvirga aerophila]